MKNIFITGGAGYIGSHAVKLFLEKGFAVTVYDSLFRGYRQVIDILSPYGPLQFIQGDLLDKSKMVKALQEKQYDAVFHFAATCIVKESMIDPGLYFRTNALGTLNLVEAMVETKTSNLVFSSTCAVYGTMQYVPVDEKHPLDTDSVYGESKIHAEKIIKWFGTIHGLKYVILRYFNACGGDSQGLIGDSKKPSELLMQNAVRGALGIEPFFLTCSKVDTPDGTPIRDYIDTQDLAAAHFNAYTYLQDGGLSDVFNLGSGKGYSVLEIVKQVEKVCNVKIEIKEGEKRKGESVQVYANTHKAQTILNWKTQKTLEQSITSLKNWYQKHPHGYDY